MKKSTANSKNFSFRGKTALNYCWLFLVLYLFSCNLAFSQLSTNEQPISFSKRFSLTEKIQERKTTGLPSMEEIRKEDVEDSIKAIPPRFGYRLEVNWNTDNSGTWEDLSDGGKIWRLKIYSPGALSINLLYNKFWLPDSAKFFLYNEQKSQTLGAFTSINNKGSKDKPGKFSTVPIYGDITILEYYQPKGVTENPVISISYVIHGYRYITIGQQPSVLSFGGSLACNININCPEGNGFQVEKRAVAVMVMDGNRVCTGSLINTTSHNMTPYFLTANHCLGSYDAVTNPDAMDWSFWWNYESPTCANPTFPPPYFSTVGATIVANYQPSDMALLRLTEDPKNLRTYSPSWVGWSRHTTSPSAGTGIHHPQADIKKISRSFQTVTSHSSSINWTDGTTSPANSHWAVKYTQGTTQGGSSGSFLLNQDKLIVGQLHGGENICPPVTKYYGKLDWSWDKGGSAQRRLRDWLDPTGTGLSIVYTKERSINGPKIICSGSQTYTLDFPPAGATITWSISGSGTFTVSGSGATATVTKIGEGSNYLQAKIGSFLLAEKYISTLTSPVVENTKSGSCSSGGWQDWFVVGSSDNGTSGWHWYTDVLPPNVQINVYNPNSTSTWVSVKGGGGALKFSFIDNCGKTVNGGTTIYSTCPSLSIFKAEYNVDSQSVNVSLADMKLNPKDYMMSGYIEKLILFAPNEIGSVIDEEFKDGSFEKTLEVSSLKPGRYLLEVTSGEIREVISVEVP